jgi:hypothetical protein
MIRHHSMTPRAIRNLAADVAVIAALVLCFSLIAAHCQTPDAPSSTSAQTDRVCSWNRPDGTLERIPCEWVPIGSTVQQMQILPAYKYQSWVSRHPTRTKAFFILGGAAVGTGIAIVTRRGSCPKFINGYAYNGTPPCPSSNYDPSGNRR